MEGFLASDQVSLVRNPSNSEIAHQVEMLSVYQASKVEGMAADSLVGLAPGSPPNHPNKTFV